MHEYSIVASLLERVEVEARAHGAKGVHRLHLAIGELAGVEIDLLEAAYETFSQGSLCAGAELAVRRVPARWECRRCQQRLAPGGILQCAACGAPGRLVQGDEIVLQRIEMEVA